MDIKLGRQLVADELFDLTLYQKLRQGADLDTQALLDELIPIETRHLGFWQDFFQVSGVTLGVGQRLKLALLVWFCRIFRGAGVSLVLEAIEINGVKKYLRVWEEYRDLPLGVLSVRFSMMSCGMRMLLFPTRSNVGCILNVSETSFSD